MYMIVFVTAVVAIIGVYSQLFMLQALRLYSAQTGIAQTMMTWHATAVSQATNFISASSYTGTPCFLGTSLQGLPITMGATAIPCHGGAAVASVIPLPSLITSTCTDSGTSGEPPCLSFLPTGYQAATYKFYSVVYQDTSGTFPQNYVVTFVPPPPQASATNGSYAALNLLCLPGVLNNSATSCPTSEQAQLSVTLTDLYKQLKSAYSVRNFGYIQCVGPAPCTPQLVTPTLQEMQNGVVVTESESYTLPASLSTLVPANSVAIISAFPACASC